MGYKQYCKEPEKIENYERAKKDDFKGWHCHHRLETHTSDGERRLVDITMEELKALGMYYNRPASELIFLTDIEHGSFNKGKKRSDETRRKMAEAKKGKPGPNKGKKFSEEHRNKIREAMKGHKNTLGHHHSYEAKNKIAKSMKGKHKGKHWYNNGKANKFCYECPEGFVPGRLLI